MSNKISKQDLLKIILDEVDDLDLVEEDIIHMLINEKVAKDISEVRNKQLTFGDKMSDKLAVFAGSWSFIIGFGIIMMTWIVINTRSPHPYDPYPFILLNLILSCLAAIQAPIIMMSQNRQEEKDRIRSKSDYKINLKSELIIEDLHKKIDILLKNQEKLMTRLAIQNNRVSEVD